MSPEADAKSSLARFAAARPAGPGAFLYGIRKWQVMPEKAPAPKARKRSLRPWTTRDLARLAAMSGKADLEVAFALGRSVCAVQHQRRRAARKAR